MKWHALSVLLVAGGCDVFGPTVCTLEARAGINLTIVDSLTNGSIKGWPAITLTDGAYTETFPPSVLPPGLNPDTATFIGMGLAFERGGNYTLSIRHPRYADWTQSGLRVTEGECHVNPIHVRARLRPRNS